MRVGLVNIEPKVFNTAYMQIAAYHKGRGDTVEWWLPLIHRHFDVVYCSSLFDFTDKSGIPDDVICGGTGFDVTSRLSRVIEDCDLDYNIYPDCRTSYLWFSRGCIRDCPWCIVRAKEGGIKAVEHKNLNPKGEYVTVCDNNFFASRLWPEAISALRKIDQSVDFQGVDVRILTKDICRSLRKLRHYKQIKIAWDDPREDIRKHLKRALKFIPYWQLMCYVLIGYDSSEEEDLWRIETLRSLGIDPFVMPYDKSDLYQRTLARWVNFKAIFKKVKWPDYKQRVLQSEAAGCGWSVLRSGAAGA